MDDLMDETPRSLEKALLRGTTVGYTVCVKARRFALLPDAVATTFAEIGDDNCYYVFQNRAEAERRMEALLPNEKLGFLFSIKEVEVLADMRGKDGPRLDPRGQPFAMRGFVVDQAGVTSEWTWGARLGWRGSFAPTDSDRSNAHVPSEPNDNFLKQLVAWFRAIGSG